MKSMPVVTVWAPEIGSKAPKIATCYRSAAPGHEASAPARRRGPMEGVDSTQKLCDFTFVQPVS
jgi:hypothetical protein